MKSLVFMSLIPLFLSCSRNYLDVNGPIALFANQGDSSVYYISYQNDKPHVFYFHIFDNKLVEYELRDSIRPVNIHSIRDKMVIYYKENGDIITKIGYFEKKGILNHRLDFPFPYLKFQFASDGNYFYGLKDKNNWNSCPEYFIDQFDSSGIFQQTIGTLNGHLSSFYGLTPDNNNLLLFSYSCEEDRMNRLTSYSVYLGVKPLISHDRIFNLSGKLNNSFLISRSLFPQPSLFSDSVYVLDVNSDRKYMVSVWDGHYRELRNFGSEKINPENVSLISEFRNIPFACFSTHSGAILIYNTDTGKLIKIEPDRKPDEVIPLKIVYPEKIEPGYRR